MESFTSQPIVDKASSAILAIMKTKVLQPVAKNASQVDVWHEAIEDIRAQLELIRPIADMAQDIPLYAVAADIQLAGWDISKGWPSWSAIVGLDVSAQPDHPWLAMAGQVPTQSKPPGEDEDISMDEVPIVATKRVQVEKPQADRKGKGKQREVATVEDSDPLDRQETDIEVEESSPPPQKPVPTKAPKRGRSRAPSRAPSAMPEKAAEQTDEDAESVSEGSCATCAQRGTQCIARPGKACLQCNQRKVKCSLAPQRGRSVARSQPLPPPPTKPTAPAPSTQPTEGSKPPKGSKDSDSSKRRSKGHRHRSRQSSPDVLRAPIKLKIPQSTKRVREPSPSVERQTRQVRHKLDSVLITKPPPGGPSKSATPSAKVKPMEERMADVEDTLKSFGKLLQSLVDSVRVLEGDRSQRNLEPGSGDGSSRPSVEGSGQSLPPSSSAPTTALDPSPISPSPLFSLPPSGSVPPSALDPLPISSVPPPPPSALLATASTDSPPPPSAPPISPLEATDSVPEIVVSLPEANTSVAGSSAPAAGWNAGFLFGSYRPPALFASHQGVNDKGTKPTDAAMEE